jgi:hypothetical protein
MDCFAAALLATTGKRYGKRLEIPRRRGNDNSSMRVPPLLPEETLRRVLRIARLDGLSVLVIAGLFGLLAAAAHDVRGAAVGLLIAGGGAIELHGVGLLRIGEVRGMRWLVGSQFYLLVTIMAYVGLRLSHVDIEPMRVLLNEQQRQVIAQSAISEDQFLRAIYFMTYSIFGIVTLFYQGGMSVYYQRRHAAVSEALASPTEIEL